VIQAMGHAENPPGDLITKSIHKARGNARALIFP